MRPAHPRGSGWLWIPVLTVSLASAVAGCTCEALIGESDGGPPGSIDSGPVPDGTDAPPVGQDTGTGCPGVGEERCSGACVNTQIDPASCGGCGLACGAGEACVSGGCVADCPAALSECAGTCVDTDTDSAHCGGCGMACGTGEGCVAGDCTSTIPLGPAPARCVAGGPPITIGGGGSAVCTGAVSAATFTNGLCACRDVGVPSLGSRLGIDAFDSSMGPYEPGGAGGSLGANGELSTSELELTGDLTTTAEAGLSVRARTTVGGVLRVRGELVVSNDLSVEGDAFVGGAVSGGSSATIAGALHTPDCSGVPGSVDSASCVSEPVTVEDPCECGDTERLPIAAIVSFYAAPANNDNAAVGLSPDALDGASAPTRLDLPCGYYHLEQISIASPTVIAVHGRTALFVSGSVDVTAALTFALDPGGTLDVYVAGTIRASSLRVGTPAYPRESRVFVGGACEASGGTCALDAECCSHDCASGTCAAGDGGPPRSITLSSESALAGLFYAPNGLFTTSSALEMYGALFVGEYHSGSETRIHYDGAAARTGEDCPPPPDRPDAGPGPDGGPPPDGAVPACTTGEPSCGPGLPACPTDTYCILGCCTYFG